MDIVVVQGGLGEDGYFVRLDTTLNAKTPAFGNGRAFLLRLGRSGLGKVGNQLAVANPIGQVCAGHGVVSSFRRNDLGCDVDGKRGLLFQSSALAR